MNEALTESDFEAQRLEQAEKALDFFRDRIRAQIADFAEQALSEAYTDIVPYLETDAWANLRRDVLADFCDYSTGNNRELRRSIYEQYRDEIVADLNQDNLERIADLEKQVDFLKEMLTEERRRY